MELLYVWIEKYRNIEKQGFNFSPRWRFDYNSKTGYLDIEDRKEQVIGNFFGKRISNVTAIVGANGSGKTNLLAFLEGQANLSNMYFWDERMVLAIRYQNIVKIFHHKNIKLELRNHYEKEVKKIAFSYKDLPGIMDEFPSMTGDTVYRSGILNYGKNLKIGTLSANYELSDVWTFSEYVIKKLEDQFDLISEFYNQKDFIDFDLPKKVKLKYNYVPHLSQYSPLREDTKSIIDVIEKRITETLKSFSRQAYEDEEYKKLMEIGLFHSLLCLAISIYRNGALELIAEVKKQLEQEFNYEKLLELFYEKDKELTKHCSKETMEQTIALFASFLHGPGKATKGSSSNDITIELKFGDSKDMDFLKKYFDVLNQVSGLSGLVNMFSFDWIGISAGQEAYLQLYASIYKGIHDKGEDRYYLLLLDEAETSFHPKWQRKLIDQLMKNLPKILPKCNIQIILSTHSPFILSDLPKENVIFLDKDTDGKCKVHDGLKDKKQSFGANIHTLLSDGFFMDSLIGKFAKGKINKVIKFLNNESRDLTEKEAQKIVNMIGEPILQRELQRRMKLRSVDALKTQVADLEARIKELENKDQ